MSCYINFFIRVNGTFAPIGSFSRDNKIFKEFEHIAPWEKIRPIDRSMLRDIQFSLEDDKADLERAVQEKRSEKKDILAANNTLEEKIEYLNAIENYIRECREEEEEITVARGYVRTLQEILCDVAFEDDFNEGEYIYIGMEIGCPTIEDIE